MATQKITKTNLKIIFDKVCENWQKQLTNILLWSEGKEVELDNDLIVKGYNEANTEQKKLIEKYFKIAKPEDICEKIQDWNDVLEINGLDSYKDLILKPKTKEEKSINALNRLFLIAKAYNGVDFEFNWKNTNEYKWRPYKNFCGGGSLVVHYWCGHLSSPGSAHFKTEKFAKDALSKFKSIFEDYLYE